MKTRIMYIERKTGGSEAWIGRVRFSQSGRTIYYRDLKIQSSKGRGIYGNYFDEGTAVFNYSDSGKMLSWSRPVEYWVSGPKKDGRDRLTGNVPVINIDDDVREEYWTLVRGLPANANQKTL